MRSIYERVKTNLIIGGIIAILVLLSECVFSQHATLVNDTVTYNERKFIVGDTLHLFYGSTANKDFAFIWVNGADNAKANYAKTDCIVDKVYKTQGTIYARCKIIGTPGKLYIAIEGAIDNKEIN